MDRVTAKVLESGTIQPDYNYIVGVSGGPDSLCLLHILMKLKDQLKIGVIPVHVNHKLRKNADKEQKHLEKVCRDMGIACNCYEVDCKALAKQLKVSLEEAGRAARYNVFDKVAEALIAEGAQPENIAVAVAHNADDQSETVLFRMIRGTGLRGLVGIRAASRNMSGRLVVRPLLNVSRCDIEEYINENGLKANHDESNDKTDATRNKIRLELIPYIEENINENVKDNLRRMAELAASDDDFMEQVAYAVYEGTVELRTSENKIVLHTGELQDQHVAIISRVIGLILRGLGLDREISYSLINGVMEVLFSGNPSAEMDLPNGLVCQRRYKELAFGAKSDCEGYENACDKMRLVPMVMKYDEYKKVEKKRKSVFAGFDYQAFLEANSAGIGKIALRTREKGDFMVIAKGKRKKLQDFFVDSKIPKAERDSIPVVAIGSEIIWIPPHAYLPTAEQQENGKYSQNYQITNKSEEVLFLELVRPV